MTLNFRTTADSSFNGVKALVHGPAGVGKTVLCSTAPGPIIISAENGLLSLRHTRIPVIEITTRQQLDEAVAWCLRSTEMKNFHTICVDSVSEIAERILTDAKLKTRDPRQAYGELLTSCIDAVKTLRDIRGKNVYVTAKQEANKDQFGRVKYGPSLPGSKLSPQFPYLFDEVFAMGISGNPGEQSYRYLQTQPDALYDAKDRAGCLDLYEPPDLTHIFTKIFRSI